ncbi:MAG: hypothetical protein AAFQ59_12240 [Pseudomonadota bacterium]
MRELGFHVAFRPAPTEQFHIVIYVGEGFTSRELIEDGIFGDSIGNFVNAIAAAKGMQSRYQMVAATPREVHINAARAVLDQPWQIASILNMIDGATFLGQEDDDPFIDRVEVAEPQTLEGIYQNLAGYMESCRVAVQEWLPEDAEVLDGSDDRRWPAPAVDYMYNVALMLSDPLSGEAQAQIAELLEQLDQVMAESAFEPETGPDEWFDEGIVPYPVEFDIKPQEILYTVEMPPTDIAPILLMLMAVLQRRYNVRVTRFDANIREGW